VTTIVVPDQADLPLYEKGRGTAYAVGLLTAAMGRPPVYDHAAWVWSGVSSTGAPVPMTESAFDNCVLGAPGSPSSAQSVATCVLDRGR
jgi:hypothetical protein